MFAWCIGKSRSITDNTQCFLSEQQQAFFHWTSWDPVHWEDIDKSMVFSIFFFQCMLVQNCFCVTNAAKGHMPVWIILQGVRMITRVRAIV